MDGDERATPGMSGKLFNKYEPAGLTQPIWRPPAIIRGGHAIMLALT